MPYGASVSSSIPSCGEVYPDIKIDDVTCYRVPVIVVPDTYQRVDIMVGRKWLNQPHVSFTKKGATLSFYDSDWADLPVSQAEQTEFQETRICAVIRAKLPIEMGDVNFGSVFTLDQQKDILAVINKFRDAFSTNIFELGCTHLTEMEIIEKPGATPFQSKPYRTSVQDRQKIAEVVNAWKAAVSSEKFQASIRVQRS